LQAKMYVCINVCIYVRINEIYLKYLENNKTKIHTKITLKKKVRKKNEEKTNEFT